MITKLLPFSFSSRWIFVETVRLILVIEPNKTEFPSSNLTVFSSKLPISPDKSIPLSPLSPFSPFSPIFPLLRGIMGSIGLEGGSWLHTSCCVQCWQVSPSTLEARTTKTTRENFISRLHCETSCDCNETSVLLYSNGIFAEITCFIFEWNIC